MKALALILLLSLALFAVAQEDLDLPIPSQTLTVQFKKGWNVMPSFSGPQLGEQTCKSDLRKEDDFIGLAYLWSPTLKKYIIFGPPTKDSKKLEEDMQKGYMYLLSGGLFIYVAKDCQITINKYTGFSPFGYKIAQGWQFVAKVPWMKNKKFEQTFSACTVEKYNQWDNIAKKWKYPTSSGPLATLQTDFDAAAAGEVFLIKFASECDLGVDWGDILEQPPVLE